MGEKYMPAELLAAGDVVLEADGFELAVVKVELTARVALVTLTPVEDTAAWRRGEERTQKVGRGRMVRLAR